MVSLGPNEGHRQISHSGFAFRHTSDVESVHNEDVDLLTESTYISTVINQSSLTCLCLPWIACIEALLLVTYEIMIFILADVLMVAELGGRDPPFSFLALLHVVLWLVVLFFHFLLAQQHNQLRLHGYLDFSHSTEHLRKVQPLVLSFGNAILLGFFSIMDHAWSETSFHHYRFLQIVYSLEFIIMFPAIICYIGKVMKFKQKRSLPDCSTILQNNCFERSTAEGEVGYSGSDWPHGVLEKQADMIRYLQKHNENLSQRVLRQSRVSVS